MLLKYFLLDNLFNFNINKENNHQITEYDLYQYRMFGLFGGACILYPHISKSLQLKYIDINEYCNINFIGSLLIFYFSYKNYLKSLMYISGIWGGISILGGINIDYNEKIDDLKDIFIKFKKKDL